MNFLALFVFCVVVASARPEVQPRSEYWSVDDHLPDGLYQVGTKKDGTPFMNRREDYLDRFPYKKTDAISSKSRSQLNRLLPRNTTQKDQPRRPPSQIFPVADVGCWGHSDPLEWDNYQAAKQALLEWCSQNLVSSHQLALMGDVQVWVCNHKTEKGQKNACGQYDYDAAEEISNSTCGELRPAWLRSGKLWKSYGRGHRGQDMRC